MDNLQLYILLALTLSVGLLFAKQFATPLPISDSKFQAMIERVAVLEAKVDQLRDIIAEKDSLISWYKARYGDAELMAEREKNPIKLLEQGYLTEALDAVLRDKDGEGLDTAIILKGQFIRAEAYKAKGLISISEHSQMLDKISDSLLTLLKAK